MTRRVLREVFQFPNGFSLKDEELERGDKEVVNELLQSVSFKVRHYQVVLLEGKKRCPECNSEYV